MAKKKEQTEQERIAELRKNYIEALKRDIPKMPDKYDASKLPEVIKYVESVPDENLDACLIMERPLSMLSVAYSWDDTELKKVTDVFDKLGYAIKESKTLENEKGEVDRDDKAYVIKKDDHRVVVWISKMRPFIKPGMYHLLGINLEFPSLSFENLDDMVKKMETMILEDKV